MRVRLWVLILVREPALVSMLGVCQLNGVT